MNTFSSYETQELFYADRIDPTLSARKTRSRQKPRQRNRKEKCLIRRAKEREDTDMTIEKMNI